jgi:hypothetical protein
MCGAAFLVQDETCKESMLAVDIVCRCLFFGDGSTDPNLVETR